LHALPFGQLATQNKASLEGRKQWARCVSPRPDIGHVTCQVTCRTIASPNQKPMATFASSRFQGCLVQERHCKMPDQYTTGRGTAFQHATEQQYNARYPHATQLACSPVQPCFIGRSIPRHAGRPAAQTALAAPPIALLFPGQHAQPTHAPQPPPVQPRAGGRKTSSHRIAKPTTKPIQAVSGSKGEHSQLRLLKGEVETKPSENTSCHARRFSVLCEQSNQAVR
jgi:hypothetical protein